ncbi:MAG: glycosyl transferase, partial [Clostridia bacterium]|nr:glycosyl transferase [Clostridia bacterium]
VKIGILKLNNKSLARKKLRIVYYLKPVLGEDEIKSNGYINSEFNRNGNLIEVQNLYENEFKDLMFVSSSEKIKSYTGDKNAFFGKGGISNPDALKKYQLDNSNSLGKKACVAIEVEVELESMSSKEIVLSFGTEENIVDMKNLAYKYSRVSNCRQELEDVKKKWKDLLEKLQVYSPIESMNIMLNGWTLYQTMSSRLLGRTGFYQSGGAFGFRDQLQDSLAFKFTNPEILKNQIIKHSKHQFIEGDVEHWWHEETGRGIRTKFSDDLAWLAFLVEQYIETTGDYEILEIETPYLDGKILQEAEEEKYDLYKSSELKENIYMHCVRAIERTLSLGEHGLPKIGIGDWNDGFSTVGNKGKGESVWLGFFIYEVLTKFIPLCKKMQDENRVQYFTEISELLRKNLNKNGWDGRWFKRAYTDDGEILGSIENEECRIDGISQSWSVISGAGDNDKKFISMESLENHLVDRENGIIKLLDPPFENGKLKPGYIKAYLPGVRENGGQYTHGAIWGIIAEAMLGFGDKGTELYRMINPIEHTRTKEAAKKYKVEPYVIPADVYGAGNLAGRGGWTWYTGSSSWFYVAGIQYILGFNIKENMLSFNPCIPKNWKEYSIRYKYENSIYNIKITNPNGKQTGVTKVFLDGKEIDNCIKLDGTGKIFNVEVEM